MSRKKRSIKKRILGSPLFLWPLIILVSVILRLIYATNRKTMDMGKELEPYRSGEKPAIYCFWHGRMIGQLFIDPRKRRMYVLSSPSRDGVIAAILCRCFGIFTVYGSRSKGATAAAISTRGLLGVIAAGHNISITPDGPRGPLQTAAPGAAYLASKSGRPLIPVTFSATRYKRLRSWDRFLMFKPFGHIHYAVGNPIHVAADADDALIAQVTQQLQAEMNRLTDKADHVCGVAA